MGYLPIHCAASGGSLALAKYFIELGVNVNITTKVSIVKLNSSFNLCWYLNFVKNDRTLLQIAASQGHGDIVEYLLNQNADVNFQDKVWHV